MDRLDVRIVREFLQGEPLLSFYTSRPSIRPAFRALGEKLGVSESTVRDRFERLSGFLSGGALMMNPGLLGEGVAALEFEVSAGSSKDEVLGKVRLVDGVFMVIDHSGPSAVALFFYPVEAGVQRRADLILRLAGARAGALTDIPFPRCNMAPSKTDFQIIASRQEDAAKPNRRIAAELGISSRTVRRRFARLVSGGAILPIFSLRMDALQDGVFVDLHVEYSDPRGRSATEGEILSILDEYLVFNGHFVAYSIFNLILPSIPVARRILEHVRRLRNVQSARVDFVEARLESYELFREKTKKQISLTAAHRWK